MTERLLPIVEEQGKVTSILRILKREPWPQKLLSEIMQYDTATFDHSLRTGVIAFDISSSLNLSPKDISQLALAGFLHDIGKLAVPYDVLNAGTLNPERKEEFFEEHADRGKRIVEPYDHQVAEIIGGHHIEQAEQTLRSSVNPLLAFRQRIVTIADQVDSLISKRPYKKSWSPQAVSNHLNSLFESPEMINVAINSRVKMAA